MKEIDVAAVRADTPGTDHVIHFNNAGAGLMATPVLDAVTSHLRLEAEIGAYEAHDRARDAFENTYRALAKFLNCGADEIALMENATVAWQAAFYGLAAGFKAGDRILTAEAEYASNYIAYLQVARRTGAVVEVVPSTPEGELDVAALRRMIDGRVKLIAITHVPTNGGLINPAAAVGEIAREHGIPYLLDACQSAGQVPLDVEEIGCDALSVTGRKYLRGPRGTGFLYIKRSLIERIEPPMLDLHGAVWTAADSYKLRDDAKRFENWEFNVAGQIGLGVAVDYANALGQDAIFARIRQLANRLRGELAEVPGVTLRDIGREKGGIVTFTVDGVQPVELKEKLRADAINCTASKVSSTRLDMTKRGLDAVVRASVHYYNTEDEIARFCAAVARLAV